RFHLEPQCNAVIGLDPNDQDVRPHTASVAAEHQIRRRSELECDLGATSRHALARPKVKWDSLPAPVVDEETQGSVCRCDRPWIDIRLLAISRHPLSIDRAGTVLRPNRRRNAGGK